MYMNNINRFIIPKLKIQNASIKTIAFGQKNCIYESDSFQKEFDKPSESTVGIILEESNKHPKANTATIIDEIATTFEENNFLIIAKKLFEKSREIKVNSNEPKKNLIHSYVYLQRICKKLNRPEEVERYKLMLDKEVNNA